MNTFFKQFLLLIPALLIASVADAYTPPSGTAPANNSDGPITVGVTNSVKNGSLGVGVFQARGNALLSQDVFFSGLLHGGHSSDTASSLAIGTSTTPMDTVVTGTVSALSGKSSTLAHSGSTPRNVCAQADGTYVLCAVVVTPPPTDVCPNIAGTQSTIPSGMILNGSGDCVTPPPPVAPTSVSMSGNIIANAVSEDNNASDYFTVTNAWFNGSICLDAPAITPVNLKLKWQGGVTYTLREKAFTMAVGQTCADIPSQINTITCSVQPGVTTIGNPINSCLQWAQSLTSSNVSGTSTTLYNNVCVQSETPGITPVTGTAC